MKTFAAIAVALACLVGFQTAADAQSKVKLRRFAYIIGANDGGAERVKLRYAGTDAAKVATLLRDLGGVAPSDVVMSTGSTVRQITDGFARLAPKLAAARKTGVRVELVLYYSGHSDERGLLVGEDRLDYAELRKRLKAMPADVNIAILDSCASGAFTRTKGGKREPAFLVDESSKVTGYAFISSSSADEVAQESDRISASFFTHYLISGLRGGADANNDRKVTLNEAYQYAFAETVARTESTIGGAQHPAYNMHLVGTGDVVMTDLRSTSASLVVAKGVSGRLFIRDSKGVLAIELNKPKGRAARLGLSPDTYAITLKRDGKLYRARITLKSGAAAVLEPSAFGESAMEATTSRGAAPIADDDLVAEPFRLSFIPQLRVGGSKGQRTRLSVSLNILAGRGDALRGVEIGGLFNVMHEDMTGVQLAGLVNADGGRTRGVRVAGLANIGLGDQRGLELGGLANINLERGVGVQVAGLSNVSYRGFEGVQAAGLANISSGDVQGVQVASLVNIARSVRGLQLGVVNIAEESDYSVGLVNVVRNGYQTAEVWSSDTMPLHVGVKLGARRTYSILAISGDEDNYYAGAGLGLHTGVGRLSIDIDAIAYYSLDHDFNESDINMLTKARIAFGFDLANAISVFGGPALTGALFFDGKPAVDVSPFGGKTYDEGDTIFTLTPGLFAGVRMRL